LAWTFLYRFVFSNYAMRMRHTLEAIDLKRMKRIIQRYKKNAC
jgi:hypothetical protein